MSELTLLVGNHARDEGVTATTVPNLYLYRYSSKNPSDRGIPGPSLCVVVQGAKQTILGNALFLQPAGDYMLTPISLPVTGNVVKASVSEPFLGFRYDFDIRQMTSFVLEHDLERTTGCSEQGVSLNHMSADLKDVFVRLLRLLNFPEEVGFLEPLIRQEIFYRIIRNGHKDIFGKIARSDSHIHRIARVIQWMKQNVDRPLSASDIARNANMSSSMLYDNFRNVAGMSPIQFHKQLRLQQARSMLLAKGKDITSVAISVGYKSLSQFSREYARLFGRPPGRDLQHFKGSEETMKF